MFNSKLSLNSQVMDRITQAPDTKVWTPRDFLDLGRRDAVDKALQRLVGRDALRRVDRGLYDKPKINSLTRRPTSPDYRSVIDAVGRRDQLRLLIDGMTAANDLGLTNAVPGQVIVHTDGRLRPIKLDNLTIQFKITAPSKLYWAGRPAMKIVQSLYWLRDAIKTSSATDQEIIRTKLSRVLQDPKYKAIKDDLTTGMYTVPVWMQKWLKNLLTTLPDDLDELPKKNVSEFVKQFSLSKHIQFKRSGLDDWAEAVTRASGDDVKLDDTVKLLVTLKKNHLINARQMARLLTNHLREQKSV